MSRSSPELMIEEEPGNKFKNLADAQKASLPETAADLTATMRRLLEIGWLVIKDNKIIPDVEKIKKENKKDKGGKIYW